MVGRGEAARQLNVEMVMTNPNSTNNENNAAMPSEANDPKAGENDSPQAITGAVEAGWNGSVAGTNEALEPDENTQKSK